ncbi:MAG TPA: O-antigen ligase family protein [Pyrinomonadaceae bacterium]|jgi:O-antigen ligase|nr:O-antigen ligase family protein [Pyrinomonadaceae bacterium]
MSKSPPSSLIPHPSSLAAWLDRAVVFFLFVFALFAPHSIAATQGAWLCGMLLWVARYFVRPRPVLARTPLDYALLGFFILTFFSTLFSYDRDVSIGKLRAASLFTIVYLLAQASASRRVLRMLAVVLVASCMVNVVYTFGARALGRGVKVLELRAESPLYVAGVRAGDTLLKVDDVRVSRPSDIVRALETSSEKADNDDGRARVQSYRYELVYTFEAARGELLEGATPEARLGIARWSRGRDERATGFYGQYVTYAEVLQLVGSLAVGLFIALGRKRSWRGALLAVSIAGLTAALIMTLTRASWLGFLLSAFTIMLAGAASRRTLLLTACVAVPLVVAGLFVLQQKRRVGFLDRQDASTTWRLDVWREGAQILLREPRHLLVGTGMDSLKGHWREWGMFDGGRQPWGHLHSTPLQLAFERGLPTLLCWLVLVALYARMLWRLVRSRNGDAALDWIERGTVLGALGGLVGFLVSGLVHYNFGDSEVVMVFYFMMGLALAIHLRARDEDARARDAARSVR